MEEACPQKAATTCGEAIVCAGPSGTGFFLFFTARPSSTGEKRPRRRTPTIHRGRAQRTICPARREGTRGRNQQNLAQALPEHPGLGVLRADRHCRWPASAVQAKKRMTHRVWGLCKLILQRWIGAPDFPSEWAGTGLTSLKRQ